MPGKILGIDISDHRISAVQVISGLKGYEMVSCFSTPIIDNNFEKALGELTDGFDLKSDKCILTVPASKASFRTVNTPFKDSKKIRQTLPFEIETLVPFSVDEKIIDYIHTDDSNPASILTAAINKDYLADYIEQFKTAGIEPDIIGICPVPAVIWLLRQEKTPENGIYLDLEPEHPCIVIFQDKKIVLIRELPCSFTKKAENSDTEENIFSFSEPIENIINTICREADRTVFSFFSREKNSFTMEKVFFGGRLSAHSNTSDILKIFFKTPAERINISKDIGLKMETGLSGIYKPALMDNALAAAIRETKKSPGFNFRRDEFALKRRFLGPGKDIKRIAVFLGTFFFLLCINTCVDYYYINKKHEVAEEYFNKEFDKRLSDQKGVKGTKRRIPIAQQRINEYKNPSSQTSEGTASNYTVLDVLEEISKRVGDVRFDFDVNTFNISGNDITINATTDNRDTMANIHRALQGSDLFKKTELGTAKQAKDKDRIEFILKLVRAE